MQARFLERQWGLLLFLSLGQCSLLLGEKVEISKLVSGNREVHQAGRATLCSNNNSLIGLKQWSFASCPIHLSP